MDRYQPGTGGFIDTASGWAFSISPIVSPEALGQVTLDDTPNRVVKLSDVATISADHAPLIGDAAVPPSGPRS